MTLNFSYDGSPQGPPGRLAETDYETRMAPHDEEDRHLPVAIQSHASGSLMQRHNIHPIGVSGLRLSLGQEVKAPDGCENDQFRREGAVDSGCLRRTNILQPESPLPLSSKNEFQRGFCVRHQEHDQPAPWSKTSLAEQSPRIRTRSASVSSSSGIEEFGQDDDDYGHLVDPSVAQLLTKQGNKLDEKDAMLASKKQHKIVVDASHYKEPSVHKESQHISPNTRRRLGLVSPLSPATLSPAVAKVAISANKNDFIGNEAIKDKLEQKDVQIRNTFGGFNASDTAAQSDLSHDCGLSALVLAPSATSLTHLMSGPIKQPLMPSVQHLQSPFSISPSISSFGSLSSGWSLTSSHGSSVSMSLPVGRRLSSITEAAAGVIDGDMDADSGISSLLPTLTSSSSLPADAHPSSLMPTDGKCERVVFSDYRNWLLHPPAESAFSSTAFASVASSNSVLDNIHSPTAYTAPSVKSFTQRESDKYISPSLTHTQLTTSRDLTKIVDPADQTSTFANLVNVSINRSRTFCDAESLSSDVFENPVVDSFLDIKNNKKMNATQETSANRTDCSVLKNISSTAALAGFRPSVDDDKENTVGSNRLPHSCWMLGYYPEATTAITPPLSRSQQIRSSVSDATFLSNSIRSKEKPIGNCSAVIPTTPSAFSGIGGNTPPSRLIRRAVSASSNLANPLQRRHVAVASGQSQHHQAFSFQEAPHSISAVCESGNSISTCTDKPKTMNHGPENVRPQVTEFREAGMPTHELRRSFGFKSFAETLPLPLLAAQAPGGHRISAKRANSPSTPSPLRCSVNLTINSRCSPPNRLFSRSTADKCITVPASSASSSNSSTPGPLKRRTTLASLQATSVNQKSCLSIKPDVAIAPLSSPSGSANYSELSVAMNSDRKTRCDESDENDYFRSVMATMGSPGAVEAVAPRKRARSDRQRQSNVSRSIFVVDQPNSENVEPDVSRINATLSDSVNHAKRSQTFSLSPSLPNCSPRSSYPLPFSSPSSMPSLSPYMSGDYQSRSLLPVAKQKDNGAHFVTVETVAALLDGKFDDVVDDFDIIDCRFPYEFCGGHIRGARNCYLQSDVDTMLEQCAHPNPNLASNHDQVNRASQTASSTSWPDTVSSVPDEAVVPRADSDATSSTNVVDSLSTNIVTLESRPRRSLSLHHAETSPALLELNNSGTPSTSSALASAAATSVSGRNKVLIFHCEFSEERGPAMAAYLRRADRLVNNDHYPRVFYPHVFVMDGGYRKFQERFAHHCEPHGYIPMQSNRQLCRLFQQRCKSSSALTYTNAGSTSSSLSSNNPGFMSTKNYSAFSSPTVSSRTMRPLSGLPRRLHSQRPQRCPAASPDATSIGTAQLTRTAGSGSGSGKSSEILDSSAALQSSPPQLQLQPHTNNDV